MNEIIESVTLMLLKGMDSKSDYKLVGCTLYEVVLSKVDKNTRNTVKLCDNGDVIVECEARTLAYVDKKEIIIPCGMVDRVLFDKLCDTMRSMFFYHKKKLAKDITKMI